MVSQLCYALDGLIGLLAMSEALWMGMVRKRRFEQCNGPELDRVNAKDEIAGIGVLFDSCSFSLHHSSLLYLPLSFSTSS